MDEGKTRSSASDTSCRPLEENTIDEAPTHGAQPNPDSGEAAGPMDTTLEHRRKIAVEKELRRIEAEELGQPG